MTLEARRSLPMLSSSNGGRSAGRAGSGVSPSCAAGAASAWPRSRSDRRSIARDAARTPTATAATTTATTASAMRTGGTRGLGGQILIFARRKDQDLTPLSSLVDARRLEVAGLDDRQARRIDVPPERGVHLLRRQRRDLRLE